MGTNSGIYSAMLTPFNADHSISIAGIPALVDYSLMNGLDGLYVGGSSGESILQSAQERALVLTEVAAYAKTRCKLIAHVGAPSTRDAVSLARLAGQQGYNSVSAIPPIYYPYDFESISDYYKSIVDAAGVPLIIYNLPALTGVDLGTDGLLKLLEDDSICGVKYTAQNLFQFWQLRQAAPDKDFFFGTDEMFLGASAMGADGGIGSTYNLIGDVYVGISKAVAAGDLDGARLLQNKANELVALLLTTGVLPGLKHALNYLGVPVGPCRRPFRPAPEAALAQLEAWMCDNLTPSQLNFSKA